MYEVDAPDGAKLAAKLPPTGSVSSAKRFQREIEALRRAAGSSTMPVVLADPEFGWYLMPRATATLADVDVPAPLELGLEILGVMAAALREPHARGEVHRDLKPANILRLETPAGNGWVVSDFGIVRNAAGATTAQITRAGSLLGTEWWAAPEQHRDAHDVTPRADVYSAGLIVAWLVTGVDPWDFAPSSLAGHAFAGPLARATSPRPNYRFSNLDEFVDACKAAVSATADDPRKMITDGRFEDLGNHLVRHPEDVLDAAREMAPVLFSEIDALYERSPDIAVDLFTRVCETIGEDIGDLSFQLHVDPVLIRGVRLCRLHYSIDRTEGTELAESVLGAISGIGQFAPADQALDWLDSLPARRQEEMRFVLHRVNAWDFFSGMAQGRFASRRKSQLVTELARGGRSTT
ncbi:protein kinase [Cellulomonas sp. PS-H5]|uniref:protein kinase domain-containing protein n=1 Tax=Cellulomonas sp. PS-H5 TaxID=2820400 RepID=UPI001C4E33BE|nr:protein kinase [Cellulomonas sp. PS-H5]MBW0253747.1 protein kinase [Cellulomonas sp. PS-H5]